MAPLSGYVFYIDEYFIRSAPKYNMSVYHHLLLRLIFTTTKAVSDLVHGSLHNCFLIRLLSIQVCGDPSVAHDENSVGNVQNFSEFRRNQQDRDSFIGKFGNDAIVPQFGSNINPLVGSSRISTTGFVANHFR
jgi:hypothetical protein